MKTQKRVRLLAIVTGMIAGMGLSPATFAESVYKTTNLDGTVSYSNVAPDSTNNAESISLLPAPSEADALVAREQLRRYQQQSEQQSEQRVEANRINAVEQAEEDNRPPPLVVNPFIGLAPFL